MHTDNKNGPTSCVCTCTCVYKHVYVYVSNKETNEEEAIDLRVGAWKELKGGIGGVGRNEGWREEEKSDMISL